MTDLETRLHALAERPVPDHAPPDELRGRATVRRSRRRRRMTASAIAATALVVIGVAVWRDGSEPNSQVTVDADASTSTAPPNADESVHTLGDVTGVTVEVTPHTGLRDGDLVEVTIDGLEKLPGAILGMCSGDVTADDPLASCDLAAVQNPVTGESQQVSAAERQQVSVSRLLYSSWGGDPQQREPYDYATEPAGCVLIVAPFELPARGVLIPLEFDDVALAASATATLTPVSGLSDGQDVTLRAEGLTPNRVLRIGLCRAGAAECDDLDYMPVTTDADGSLTATVRVWAAIYRYTGPVDCVIAGCAVVIFDPSDNRIEELPYYFADGVAAPEPELILEPAGPYSDGQEITVRGNGFRPGLDLSGQLSQCPDDQDTAVADRCSRGELAPAVVGEDGTFSTTFRLFKSLMFTGSCVTGPGCHLGWVIPHGTTLAKVPLTFTP